MADGRNHRHRQGGDGDGEVVIVEAGEVQLAAAAAKDEDGVVALFGHFFQGFHNGRGGLLSLHEGLKEVQLEGIALGVVQQVVPEVLVAGRRKGGDHGQVTGKVRQGQFLLHVHVALGRQLLDGPLALQGLLPQSERRVYVFDEKGYAVKLAETHLHLHQYGDAGTEGFSGGLLEETGEHGILPLPNHGAGFRNGLSQAALHQAQITVTVGTGAPGGDFRLYPVSARKGLGYTLLNPGLKFQEIHIFPFSHNFTKIRKIPYNCTDYLCSICTRHSLSCRRILLSKISWRTYPKPGK